MEYQNDWPKVKQRLEAFWEGEVLDRCCVAVEAPRRGKTMPLEARFDYPYHMPEQERQAYWTDAETILNNRLLRFAHTYYGGDAFPQVFANLAPAGHAGYFKGCRMQIGNSIWFDEWIHDTDTEKPVFDEESFYYKKVFELAEYFVANAKERFFIAMPDTSGNLDALAHMRGTMNLLTDLYDDREWVKESLHTLQTVLMDSLERYYQLVHKSNEGGSCIGWLNTWAKGRHAQTQCDFSVMISPEDYNELVVPELRQQIAWMDRSLYHLDGAEQLRHLDALLALEELDAIQWTCVDGQPSPVAFIPQLKQMQKAGKKLVIPCYKDPNDVDLLLENLSSKGLLLITSVSSEEEARTLVKKAETLTHE